VESNAVNKYTCTRMSVSDIYYATLIAESEDQAREMCIDEARKRGYGESRPRNWSVRVLEADVEGPAQIVDCGHREA
jgi:hypothetical protein